MAGNLNIPIIVCSFNILIIVCILNISIFIGFRIRVNAYANLVIIRENYIGLILVWKAGYFKFVYSSGYQREFYMLAFLQNASSSEWYSLMML